MDRSPAATPPRRSLIGGVGGLLAACLAVAGAAHAGALSDAQIRQLLIGQSIQAYPGNCPCPYSAARNGAACGRRSAYNRPGGYAPLCYPRDVSREQVEAYRQAHGAAR